MRDGIEGARPADDAVDFVTLLQQQIGEIRTVLAGDAGDERFFHDQPRDADAVGRATRVPL